jgi:hypothetical protein
MPSKRGAKVYSTLHCLGDDDEVLTNVTKMWNETGQSKEFGGATAHRAMSLSIGAS